MSNVKRTGESSHPTPQLIGERVREAIETAMARAKPGRERKMEYYISELGWSTAKYYRTVAGKSDPSALEIWKLAELTGKNFSWFAGVEPGQPTEEFAATADLVQAGIMGLREQLKLLERELANARRVAVSSRVAKRAELVHEAQPDVATGSSVVSRRKKRAE